MVDVARVAQIVALAAIVVFFAVAAAYGGYLAAGPTSLWVDAAARRAFDIADGLAVAVGTDPGYNQGYHDGEDAGYIDGLHAALADPEQAKSVVERDCMQQNKLTAEDYSCVDR